jgi:ubiquinone/menaquinone biosynthesis C-methylase UbiE
MDQLATDNSEPRANDDKRTGFWTFSFRETSIQHSRKHIELLMDAWERLRAAGFQVHNNDGHFHVEFSSEDSKKTWEETWEWVTKELEKFTVEHPVQEVDKEYRWTMQWNTLWESDGLKTIDEILTLLKENATSLAQYERDGVWMVPSRGWKWVRFATNDRQVAKKYGFEDEDVFPDNVCEDDFEQAWDAHDYQKHASFVPKSAQVLLEWANLKRGEKVLDLGCGDGVLTGEFSRKGCSVIGIDNSDHLLFAALSRAREEKLDIEWMRADGNDGWIWSSFYPNQVDCVFSNAALHWLKLDPAGAVEGAWKVLKPGGRFVAEMGGFGNCGPLRDVLHDLMREKDINVEDADPWFFPTAEEYRKLLEAQGFQVERIVLVPRPTKLDTDVIGWLTTFGDTFKQAFNAKEPDSWTCVMQKAQERLKPICYDAQNQDWSLPYVRLRFLAWKPGPEGQP